MSVENLIKKAVDRNIIVYDTEAKQGELTKRLIALMKTIMRRNSKSGRARMTTIYISSSVALPAECMHFRYDSNKTRILGVNIKRVDGMEKMIEKLNGTLVVKSSHIGDNPHNDTNCVLGVGSGNNVVLLGSF